MTFKDIPDGVLVNSKDVEVNDDPKVSVDEEIDELSAHVESMSDEIRLLEPGVDLEQWQCEMAVVQARCMLMVVRAVMARE